MLLSLVRMDPTPDAIYTVVSGGNKFEYPPYGSLCKNTFSATVREVSIT